MKELKQQSTLKIKYNLPIPYELLTTHNKPIKGLIKFRKMKGNWIRIDQMKTNISWVSMTTICAKCNFYFLKVLVLCESKVY